MNVKTQDCLRPCFLIVLILFVWIKVANYSWTILQFLILIVSNEVILNVLFPGPAPGPAGIRRRDPITSHFWFRILLNVSAPWWQVVSLSSLSLITPPLIILLSLVISSQCPDPGRCPVTRRPAAHSCLSLAAVLSRVLVTAQSRRVTCCS